MQTLSNIINEYEKAVKGLSKLKTDVVNDLLSLGFLVGLIILVAGFVMLLTELYMIFKIHTINNWPIVENGATIINSYMETSMNSSSYNIILAANTQFIPYYRTGAAFIYTVNGKTYFGDKISYYEPWQENAIVSRLEKQLLKPNSVVNVRINPNNPEEAYIFNKPYDRYYRFAFALAVFLLGLFIVISV